MRRFFVFLLITLSVFASFGTHLKPVAGQNQSGLVSPTATPTDDSESLLRLSKKEVIIPCPPNYRSIRECPDEQFITIEISGTNSVESKNVYKYEVTGGRIVGEGGKVRWDLSNTRPGTYHIRAFVSDGKNKQEANEIITVRDCDCGGDTCLTCPTISVIEENQAFKASETFVFKADVAGGSIGDITYNWTVSQGEIIDGQGTPTITVKTNDKMKGSIKATVEIGGLICDDCLKTASATAQIIK